MEPGLFDDLAVFLAVRDAGSISGAARALKLDASTVSRRIARLEERLGSTLLVRSGRGIELSDTGQQLATRVQGAVNLVALGIDEITRQPDVLSGPVRITAPTEVGSAIVIPSLQPFLTAHPEVTLIALLGTLVLSLDKREADIALRTHRPTTGDIVAKRIAGRPLHAYRAPTLPEGEARMRWLAWPPPDPIVDPLLEKAPDARVVLRSNDLAGLRAACVAGLGAAFLPDVVADPLGLVRMPALPTIPGPPLWMAAHRTALELPRVRALWDFITELFEEGRRALDG
jgi:DNA-binding transcriptional LysR family regulator